MGVMSGAGAGVGGVPPSPMYGGPSPMYGSFMDHYMTQGGPPTPDVYGQPAGISYRERLTVR
jgi:hypothetical protein